MIHVSYIIHWKINGQEVREYHYYSIEAVRML